MPESAQRAKPADTSQLGFRVYAFGYNGSVLTLAEAADRLGVHADTLRRQVHRGKLRAKKRRLGGYEVWVVTEAEVERYQRENQK